MKVVELLKIGSEMLKLLSENDVRLEDYKYVKMYQEYLIMRENGIKYRAAVKMLAGEYGIGRATVERIVKRMRREIDCC